MAISFMSPSMYPMLPMTRVRRRPHGVNASMEKLAVTPSSKRMFVT
jgi:hypothetical protein